jgi:hypothetical protein
MAAGEREAIEAVIREYLEGMIYGQYDKLRHAMHEHCNVMGHAEGKYDFLPREDFIKALGDYPKEPVGTPIVSSIVSLDITGDTAIAKITDDCFGTTFTDYLTFIKDNGQWQIVAKAFYDNNSKG